ncbi:hypothetical protein PSPTOT1_2468 [Pseudomonas syringae pv. tomato T1]|nr:hypothetical protein PSPTOT1_2468 [Pseudomonas syringae pv. tomato T1]
MNGFPLRIDNPAKIPNSSMMRHAGLRLLSNGLLALSQRSIDPRFWERLHKVIFSITRIDPLRV